MLRAFLASSLCLTAFAPSLAFAQAAPGTAAFNPANPATSVTVGPRDTLYSIAERTRSPVMGLIEVNGLQPPYALRAGQTLSLPPLKVHVVARGETLQDVAGRYSIDPRSLAVFNRLQRPWFVAEGQRIILPALVRDRYTGLEPQDLVDLLSAELATGRPVRAQAGQTANRIETLPAATKDAPPIKSNPPKTAPPRATPPKLPPPKAAIPRPPPPRAPNPAGSNPGAGARAATPATATQPPATRPLAGALQWPLRGAVVETYGDKRGFRRSDGIDIAGELNAPFKAAADGVVAYVGNELPGYGWLVLVRHSGDLMTAYAYANRVRVREGERVRRGQEIGEIGSTGRASTPRLHFQVRRATRPVDPMGVLPRPG